MKLIITIVFCLACLIGRSQVYFPKDGDTLVRYIAKYIRPVAITSFVNKLRERQGQDAVDNGIATDREKYFLSLINTFTRIGINVNRSLLRDYHNNREVESEQNSGK